MTEAPEPSAISPVEKRVLAILKVLGGVIALSAIAFWLGWPSIVHWQVRRSLEVARSRLEAGALSEASLIARQALLRHPNSIDAAEILAQVHRKAGSPEAVGWYQKLAELDPENSARLLDLALCAAKIGDLPLAENALLDVPEKDRATAPYHRAAGVVALEKKDYGTAASHFDAASALSPNNPADRLNAASIHALSNDPAEALQARTALGELADTFPGLRATALHAMLSAARARRDRSESIAVAEKLAALPETGFAGKLALAEERVASGMIGKDAAVEELEAVARDNPGDAAALIRWLSRSELPAEAVRWGNDLPDSVRSVPGVQIAMAGAADAANDWDGLRAIVSGTKWGHLGFARAAFLARLAEKTAGGTGKPDFKLRWDRAVLATGGNHQNLVILSNMAKQWGWEDQELEVLWYIANRPVGQRAALKRLYRIYRDRKDTNNLFRVALRSFALEPDSPSAANSRAMLGLLVEPDKSHAMRLAQENHARHPDDPAAAATHAWVLALSGQRDRALEIMRGLPTDVVGRPGFAIYMGLILSAAGKPDEAKPFLETAGRSGELLPEERALLEKSQAPR